MKKVCVCLLALCLICVGLGGCTETPAETQTKYVLYCALLDADEGVQMMDASDAQLAAHKLITERGFGYAEHTAYGAQIIDGEGRGHVTLIYEFFYISKEDALSLADALKEELHIPSVLVEEVDCNYEIVA